MQWHLNHCSDTGLSTCIQPTQGTLINTDRLTHLPGLQRMLSSCSLTLDSTPGRVESNPGGAWRHKEAMLGLEMDMEWDPNYICKAPGTPGHQPLGCTKAHPGCLVTGVHSLAQPHLRHPGNCQETTHKKGTWRALL